MVGAPKGRPAPTSAATKPPTSRRLEAPRRLIKKASANVSRKQVFAAHRAVWLEKKKVADEAKRELRQQKAAHVEHLHNKKANKAFDYPTLKAVQEGLTTAIEALGEPITPLSLFMGAFTALAKSPEKHQMAYLLAILSACVPRLSQGVLYHQLEPIFNLCEQLIAENVSTNYLVATKAMKLIQSVLLSMELPTMEALHAFEKLQPNKLNLDSMKLYLGTFRKLLEQSALANASASSAANEDVVAAPHRRDPHTGLYTLNPQQKFFAHAMPHFVRVCVSNFTDATATVAATSAAELSLLFDRALSPYVVESAEGSRMINDLLSNELLSLLKPATQNYWGLALDMLEHLFARLSYVKRVRVATPSSSSSSSTAEASIIPFTTRFPSITFFLKVLNKLRSMDDATLNPKVERVMVALGKGMSVADFVEILPFDPQEAYEAELRGEGGARWANSYTLGVIRRLADHDSLPYLVEHFFPSIQFVSRQAVEAERAGRAEELTRWTALQIQYWRIAVGFCHYPTTITDGSFRDVAKQLVGLLSSPSFVDTSATALHVLCDGYHQLATAAEEEEDEDDDVELLEDDMRRPSEKPNSAEVAARHRRDRRDALDEDDLYLSMNDPTWNPHRYHNISQAVAKEGCSIFSKYSANIMPKLCNTFETHDSTAVLLAIQSFSKVCSPAVMTTILTGILTVGANIAASAQAKADGVSGSGDGSSAKAGNQPLTSKRRMILDIACAVVGQLPTEHVMSLFGDVIEPVLMDPAPESRLLQKKAYKLLFALFEHRIQDIFPLFHRVVGLIHVGRRHVTISGVKMRIRCLSWVLDACKLYHPNEMRQTIQSSIAEVILFSRERSSETRAMTMEVLEKMQRYATSAGAPSNYVLHLVIAGLSGKTAQMISSAVVCMAKMVYLTHHELPEKDLNAAVALGFQLMESSMVEVRSAASIFARMTLKLMKRSPSVAKAAKLALPKLLYAIALVTSQPHVSSTIRMQMRVLLEKCIKRFGLAEVDPIFPIGSKNFLRYTHKMMRREEKKAEHQLKKRQEEQKNEFDRLFLGASMHAGREDAAEEDLLQAGALTTFVAKHSAPTFGSTSAMFHRGEDAEDEYDTMHLDFQTDGKLRIVSMEEKHREDDLRRRQALADRLLRKNNGLLNAEAVNAGAIVNTRSGKRARTDETEDFENEELMKRYGNRVSEAAAQKAAAKLNGGRVVGPSAQQITRLRDQKAERMEAKRQRVEEDIRKGDEFQGAGVGDVKRGNIEPYAYVPLNRRYMNRRNARQALHRFEVVSNRHLKGEKAKTAAQQK